MNYVNLGGILINTPNLPTEKTNAVLIDYRAHEATDALTKLGIKVYKTPVLDIAYPAISGHPDILFHQLDASSAIVAPQAFLYFKNIFPDINIISGNSFIGRTYPDDIAYNVARVNNFAFHNEKYTDKKIKEYYKKNGIKLIDITQGYSKCSISIVSKNAIITADKLIAAKAEKYGIDALCINEKGVKLNDFPYGFIGGTCGLISKEILAFNGNIKMHPDYKKIDKFCKIHGVNVLALHYGELEDIGSIIPIMIGK